jgi:tetratricopeptide (TPR) repeat protein
MKLSEILTPLGHLTDNSAASRAFRKTLSNKDNSLEDFAQLLVEASNLSDSQKDFVLQDVINAVGNKVGFRVEHGTYVRTDSSGITFDGFWQCGSGNVFLVYNFSDRPPKINPNEVSQILTRLNTKKQKDAGVIIHAIFFVSNVSVDFFIKSLPKEALLGRVTVLSYEDFFGVLSVKEDLKLSFEFVEKLLLPESPFRLDSRLPIVEYLIKNLSSYSKPDSLAAMKDMTPADQPSSPDSSEQALRAPQTTTTEQNIGPEFNSIPKPVQRIELVPKTLAENNIKQLIAQGKLLFEQGAVDESLGHFLRIIQGAPSAGEAQLYAGVILYSKERYGEAIPYLQQAAALEMPSPNTQLMLGTAFFRMNSFEEASEEFRKGLEIDPEFAALLVGIGRAYTELGRYTEAGPPLEKALLIDPEMIDVYGALGKLAQKLGDFTKAVDLFTSGLMIDSENASFYFQIGISYDQLGRKESSIEAYEHAVHLDPRQWEYLINLGAAHYDSNNWGASIEAYQRALAINPNYGEAYARIGDAFLSIGDKNEAIGNYRRALELKPHLKDTRLSLANVLIEIGQVNDAIGIYESLLQARPDDMTVLIPLIKTYVSTGLYDKVEMICQQQLANGNNNIDLAILRGTALARSGDIDVAISLLESLVEIAPENCDLFYQLGVCYTSLHKLNYAIEAFEEALKANPIFVDANIKLAEAYALDGKKALAILNYTKVLNLSPDNQEARHGLLMLG